MQVFYQTTFEDAERIISKGFEDPDERTIVIMNGGNAGIWVSDAPSTTDDGDTMLTLDIPEELFERRGKRSFTVGKCGWALIPACELNRYGPAKIWKEERKG